MDPAQAGSGVADDLLTHLLDTALYLNGRITQGIADARTIAPNRQIDDAVMALVQVRERQRRHVRGDALRDRLQEPELRSQIHGAGGLLRFNLERLNHLEFFDATVPSTEQGPRDLLVTDLKHPIFGNFWRPGHIIGYEHTFIATLAEFLDCLARDAEFHPNFADALVTQQALDALLQSAQNAAVDRRRRELTSQREHLYDTSQRHRRAASCPTGRLDAAPAISSSHALDDRRAAVGVDHDQPARSADAGGAGAVSARPDRGRQPALAVDATRSTPTSP